MHWNSNHHQNNHHQNNHRPYKQNHNKEKYFMKNLKNHSNYLINQLAAIKNQCSAKQQQFKQIQRRWMEALSEDTREQFERILACLLQEEEKIIQLEIRGDKKMQKLNKIIKKVTKQCCQLQKELDNKNQQGTLLNNKNISLNNLEFLAISVKKEIQHLSDQIQTRVMQMEINNNDENNERLEEEKEDLDAIYTKLLQELRIKESEIKIQKNKLVIQYGKLKQLQAIKQEQQQTLRSLTIHCKQIEERVAAMRMQKKILKKKSNTGQPVRDEILITQKDNQLLKQQLERERFLLQDYQKLKKTLKSQSQYDKLKQVLHQTKQKELKIKQVISQNHTLKEQLQKYEQEHKEIKKRKKNIITDKANRRKKLQNTLNELEKQKNIYEQKIEEFQQYFMKFKNKIIEKVKEKNKNKNTNKNEKRSQQIQTKINENKSKQDCKNNGIHIILSEKRKWWSDLCDSQSQQIYMHATVMSLVLFIIGLYILK